MFRYVPVESRARGFGFKQFAGAGYVGIVVSAQAARQSYVAGIAAAEYAGVDISEKIGSRSVTMSHVR